MYAIGKLAEISHVSVRTLRYYDEIGLLLPSTKNAAGHRFYSDEEVSRLHHILMLRDLGFPLETIHQFLVDREFDLASVLKMRQQLIQAEQANLRKMESSITALLNIVETEETPDWSTVFTTFTNFQADRSEMKDFWAHYFSEEEQRIVNKFPVYGEKSGDEEQWDSLIQEVRANLNCDPKSPTAQKLAHRWMELVDRMYEGNSELAQKVWELNKTKAPHQQLFQYEPELITFIEQAVHHYFIHLESEV